MYLIDFSYGGLRAQFKDHIVTSSIVVPFAIKRGNESVIIETVSPYDLAAKSTADSD